MCIEIIEKEIGREMIPQVCRIEAVLCQRAHEPKRRAWIDVRTRLATINSPKAAHDQEVQRQDRRVKIIRGVECRQRRIIVMTGDHFDAPLRERIPFTRRRL